MKYNDLINEFLNLLDKDDNIIKIKKLKNNLINNKSFLKELEEYRLYKNVDNKKKLYQNKDYNEYLKCENNINLLILNIRNKFNIFNSRKCLK